MLFQEPKVEFVSITMDNILATSTGNYETCNGSNAYSNACSANSINWADNVPITVCTTPLDDDFESDSGCY